MAATFTKIATVTVGSGGASSIDFSSIPATYTDLCVFLSARDNNSANDFDTVNMQFNGDTGNNYSNIRLYGNGSSTASYSNTNEGFMRATYIPCDGQTASTFSSQNIYIPNYTSANYKSVSVDGVEENNATSAAASLLAGIWNSTSTITSIKLYITSYNFKQYSTATLYGIKNS